MDQQTVSRAEAARNYFLKGYNCTQSVVLAFADRFSVDREVLLSVSSSFGGGVGRLREVCGAVSGMAIVMGLITGYATPETGKVKLDHYAHIQALARLFEEKNGSIVCRELLNLSVKHDSAVPSERTAEYYKKRPCPQLVADAVEILEQYLQENHL